MEWLRANECPTGGMYAHPGAANLFPEITGYLIPTLLGYGEDALATRLVKWLLRVQTRNGSYRGPSGISHVFDTGQVLRGLLSTIDIVEGTFEASKRAARYLYGSMKNGGQDGFGVDAVWLKLYGKTIPKSSHLYVLPPFQQAAELLNEPKYSPTGERCLEHYVNDRDSLRLSTLTHFLGYELEALIDLSWSEKALPVLEKLRNSQDNEGGVPAMGGASWVCTPGLAQLAVCWYKVGDRDPADRAMKWLESHQTRSGGFLGSYGPQASYFPDTELPWAAKFYLDANLLRRQETHEDKDSQ